jgi:hypothetical protein
MARNLFATCLCAAITLLPCSQPPSAQKVADRAASPLKNRIAPPDPTKYRSVADARDWRNPYLMVQAKGVDARSINATTETATMSPVEAMAYLEGLPSVAWPYGLVVAVSENGVGAPGDDVQMKTNREELLRLLEKAGVKVELWPSA